VKIKRLKSHKHSATPKRAGEIRYPAIVLGITFCRKDSVLLIKKSGEFEFGLFKPRRAKSIFEMKMILLLADQKGQKHFQL
jgi:hypothetical protein